MQQMRKILILTLVLFFCGISSTWAAGISFTDLDGNWWQTSTSTAGGSATVTTTDIQNLLLDLADGSIDGTYDILSGVTDSAVYSGIATTNATAPDPNVNGTFSLTSANVTIDGDTNTNGKSFVLPPLAGGGNIYYSFSQSSATDPYNLDIIFLKSCDTGGYLYAGLGIENVFAATTASLPDLELLAAGLVTGLIPTYTFNISDNSNIDVIYGTTCSSVPIPGAIWLLGSGLFGLIGIRRRKNQLQA